MSFRLNLGRTIHEGLGFAAGHFGEVLRLSWLPLAVLVIGGPLYWNWLWANDPGQGGGVFIPLYFALVFLPLLLVCQASITVALTGTAYRGAPPHHRSIHFAFWGRELQFVLASILVLGLVILLSYGPLQIGARMIDSFASEQEQTTAFFFDEGSLHGGDTNLLFPDGHPIRSAVPWLIWASFGIFVVISLRLFSLPYAVASGVRRPFGVAWRAGKGFNVLRLAIVAAVILLVQVLAFFAAQVGLFIGQFAGQLMFMVVDVVLKFGVQGANWAAGIGQIVALAVSIVIALMLLAFANGIYAGIGASIVRQSEEAA